MTESKREPTRPYLVAEDLLNDLLNSREAESMDTGLARGIIRDGDATTYLTYTETVRVSVVIHDNGLTCILLDSVSDPNCRAVRMPTSAAESIISDYVESGRIEPEETHMDVARRIHPDSGPRAVEVMQEAKAQGLSVAELREVESRFEDSDEPLAFGIIEDVASGDSA